ncbi:hypothetical protein CTA1_6602 [Colletotrichum tanaceti]|uniref:Uncharacterized protein n=1 Tax=Colletotrichum tanaceti TaxID=1306861 RepID=A0A4U6XEV4_9PEZI|nr:hypothetical protein CTA1_6602 [Colletotrichum tanaceti]
MSVSAAAATMTPLTTLPTEILRCIASHLATPRAPTRPNDDGFYEPLLKVPRRSIRALRRLSQTCRLLHDVAEPFLFSHIYINQYRMSDANYDGDARMYDLLSRLASHPEYASHVRSLCFKLTPETDSCRHFSPKLCWFRDPEPRFLKGLAQRFGLRLPKGWNTACFTRSRVMASLILLHARNLEVLDVAGVFDCFLACMPFEGPGTPPRFESLRHFRFYGAVRPLSTDAVRHMCRLLRTSRRLNTVDLGAIQGGAEELTGMYLPDEVFARIIRSCRALRELLFEPRLPDRHVGPSSSGWKKPVPGWAAVLQHADTLRSLHIEAAPPLSVFNKLEMVTLPEIALGTGANCALRSLPPSLRALCVVSLRGCSHLYPKPAVTLEDWRWLASEVKQGAFPNLEELALDHFGCDHRCDCTYMLRGKIDTDVLEKSKTTWSNGGLVTSCKTADSMRTLLAMFLKLRVSCRLMNHDGILKLAREDKRSEDKLMRQDCRDRMEEQGWLDEDAMAWQVLRNNDISSDDYSGDEDDDEQSSHKFDSTDFCLVPFADGYRWVLQHGVEKQ